MNTKAKGALQERRARDVLVSQGFVVTKSSGSLGTWDLVAINQCDPDLDIRLFMPLVRLIQVKSNRWPRSGEMEELRESARVHPLPWFSCEIWRYDDAAGWKLKSVHEGVEMDSRRLRPERRVPVEAEEDT